MNVFLSDAENEVTAQALTHALCDLFIVCHNIKTAGGVIPIAIESEIAVTKNALAKLTQQRSN